MDKNQHETGELVGYSENCSECGSGEVRTDHARGETICANCGMVLSSRNIDRGPEWRAYTGEDYGKRSRVGSPATFAVYDKRLSTVIDRQDKDAHGKQLTPKRRAQIYRLRKWQTRSRVHSSLDRNLAIAMTELDRLSSQLDVPLVVKETAAILYRRAVERKLIRGRSIDAMVAASTYTACRKRKIPRKLAEIAQNSRINRKELGRCYSLMLRRLNVIIPAVSPVDFIPRFGTALRLPARVQQKAANIVRDAREKGLTVGKAPAGVAAAALYIAGLLEGSPRTQLQIAKVAGVTEVTLRNRYKDLVKKLNIRT